MTYFDTRLLDDADGRTQGGYQLVEIHQDQQEMPGGISWLPGMRGIAFYPDKEFAYGGKLFIEVRYDGTQLYHGDFSLRSLPTFISGNIRDQFVQPVEGVVVELPQLNRKTLTNADGAFSFGFGDSMDDSLTGGRYQLVVNPTMKSSVYGTTLSSISVQSGQSNMVGSFILHQLNKQDAMTPITGGRQFSLAKGELLLDLTSADVLFPDGLNNGRVMALFAPSIALDVPIHNYFTPMWLYNIQPSGVEVSGNLALDFAAPASRSGYSYLPENGGLVLLLGFDQQSDTVQPVGVGRYADGRVTSEGINHYNRLDYIGVCTSKF